MSVFFDGRLLISPTTRSVVDDSAMRNKNLSVGNTLALIGLSGGGKPKTAIRFGSPSEARAVLKSGELLTAVEKAFAPSNQTGGPSVVVALRANPATQSSLILKDALAASVIDLVSTDFGIATNQVKVKIESGSTVGLRPTTQLGTSYFTQDNVHRNCMVVSYSGAQATATMTINGTTLTLNAPANTAVATLSLANYPTVAQLVDAIGAVTGFAAGVIDGNGEAPTASALDFCSAVDVKNATYQAWNPSTQAFAATPGYMVTGHLQAIVDWFNSISEGFVTATRHTGAGTIPANVAWTYLSGGSDGTTTNTDWQDCFTALQVEDVQWVVPVTSTPAVHVMADTHVQFMSNVGRMERRAIVGMPLGSTDAGAIAVAAGINSDRTSLVHLGFYGCDGSGNCTLFPPYILAALLGGMFCGVNPGTALTNKSIAVSGLERKLRNPTDTDPLIQGGVLCVESTNTGYKVVQSISTWLTNDNYNRVEQSCGVAVDFAIRNVRNAVDSLRGAKGTPSFLGELISRADTTLRALSVPEPAGPGVLAGDATSPAYKGLTASLVGDVAQLEFQVSPVTPNNYITIVMHAVPYSGSVSL